MKFVSAQLDPLSAELQSRSDRSAKDDQQSDKRSSYLSTFSGSITSLGVGDLPESERGSIRPDEQAFLLSGETILNVLPGYGQSSLFLTSFRLYSLPELIDTPLVVIRKVSCSPDLITFETWEVNMKKFRADDSNERSSFMSSLTNLIHKRTPMALACKYPLPWWDCAEYFAHLQQKDPKLQPTKLNKSFELCSTYPEIILTYQSFDKFVQVSDFRDKGRIPVCSYPSLWRSSQPLTSFNGRSSEDEHLLSMISDSDSNGKSLLILDLRPRINALANHLKGAGTENPANYPFAEIIFCDLPNIHTVRDSWDRTWAGIYALLPAIEPGFSLCQGRRNFHVGWWKVFEDNRWYEWVSMILKTSLLAADAADHKAIDIGEKICSFKAVLVHCSDGWDRTPQITSLAMIIIDPFYRTRQGFAALIEREWVQMGHPFKRRFGIDGEGKEFSPIFAQFFDCVYQLISQNSDSFSFDDKWLIEIYTNASSGRYGNFLHNCEKERSECQVRDSTISIWNSMLVGSDQVKNPGKLSVNFSATEIRIWNNFWLRYC